LHALACRAWFSIAGAIRPRTEQPSTIADGFIYSVDDIFLPVGAALRRINDKIWQERALSRSCSGKFYSDAANRCFCAGFQHPSEGNVYRFNAESCVDPPISRFDGVNKTVGGAKKTIDGVNQTVDRANRTVDGAKKSSARVTKTIGAANQTVAGLTEIVSRATISIDGAKISSMHRNARIPHQAA
jgi:hypothetical protein